MRVWKQLVVATAGLFAAGFAQAEVKLPALFSDHMVMQAGAEVPVWGWAEPGEVWLCAGQSNMVMPVSGAKDFERERAAATLPEIRMFTVGAGRAVAAQADCPGSWVVCAPETVGEFSATAFFFGRYLHRALVPGDRQFSDEQLRLLIQRNAVIGTVFDAWMLHPGWQRGVTSPQVVGLEAAADHIDHICQLAGSARHCAIGSDLDGGFGTEQTPRDLDTLTDLHKLEAILERRGHSSADLDGIFFGNWLRFFSQALPG